MKICLDPVSLMQISVYIMLLIASFIMNFHNKKRVVMSKYSEESQEYIDDRSEQNLQNIQNRYTKNVVLTNIKENSISELEEINREVPKSYLYKMMACNIMKLFVNLSEFQFDKKFLMNKGISVISNCLQTSKNSNCLLVSYNGNKKAFFQQVYIYASVKFPSIINTIGYNITKNKLYIFLDLKENGNLESFIDDCQKKPNVKILDEANKLVIAYGIARALEFLHKNRIIHRNVKPSNIFLDRNLFPYLSDFYMAKHVDIGLPYNLKQTTIEYMAPEFINDYISNQNSFKLDVYSFGLTIYYLFTGKKPFSIYNKNYDTLKIDIINGKRPEILNCIPSEWKELIIKCWNGNPNLRPDFSEICQALESSEFINNKNKSKVFAYYQNEILDKQIIDVATAS